MAPRQFSLREKPRVWLRWGLSQALQPSDALARQAAQLEFPLAALAQLCVVPRCQVRFPALALHAKFEVKAQSASPLREEPLQAAPRA